MYDIMPMLPPDERFELRSQMTRWAISIPINIAEGRAKRSTKEKRKFMDIRLGSAFELETQLLAVQNRKWVENKLTDELTESVRTEQSIIFYVH